MYSICVLYPNVDKGTQFTYYMAISLYAGLFLSSLISGATQSRVPLDDVLILNQAITQTQAFPEEITKDLERLLTADYIKNDAYMVGSIGGTLSNWAIPHFHDEYGNPVHPSISDKPYSLDSVLGYGTVVSRNGNKFSLVLDFDAFDWVMYSIAIEEGSNVAIVIDEDGNFNEIHFKEKIQFFLDELNPQPL
jgi:hypothetical protein